MKARSPGSVRRWWLALAALASLAVIVLGSVPWYRVGSVALTGSQVSARLVPVLGYASLALAGLTLTLDRRGRRVAAIGLFGLGVANVVSGLTRRTPSSEVLAHWGASGPGTSTWAWLALVGAGMVMCVSALGLGFDGSQAGSSTRFEARPRAGGDPHLNAWKAMDAGLDPTAEEAEAGGACSDQVERDTLSRSAPASEPDQRSRDD